jgi:soluble lytic murein transglycosylase-like protein
MAEGRMSAGLNKTLATLGLSAVLAGSGPAFADVIQLSPDGNMTTYAAPTVFTREGARPVAPPPAAAPAQPRRAAHVAQALDDAGASVEVSPLLLEAVAWAESRFNQRARSPAGAIGVMQLMPATAAELGVDPTDQTSNVHGGARYLRQMLIMFDGDIERALAAYNAGPAAVKRYNGVPPFKETRAYVAAVLDYMAARTQDTAQ